MMTSGGDGSDRSMTRHPRTDALLAPERRLADEPNPPSVGFRLARAFGGEGAGPARSLGEIADDLTDGSGVSPRPQTGWDPADRPDGE